MLLNFKYIYIGHNVLTAYNIVETDLRSQLHTLKLLFSQRWPNASHTLLVIMLIPNFSITAIQLKILRISYSGRHTSSVSIILRRRVNFSSCGKWELYLLDNDKIYGLTYYNDFNLI